MASIEIDAPPLLSEPQTNSSSSCALESPAVFRDQFERVLTLIEACLDGATVAAAMFGGYAVYHLLQLGRRIEYSSQELWGMALAMAFLHVVLLDRDGAYHPGNSLLRIKETERSLRVSAQAFLLVLPITFFSTYPLSRWVFVLALISAPFLQVIGRQVLFVAVRALRARGFGVQRVVIYGAGATGRRVFSALVRSPKLGLNPVVVIDDNPRLSGEALFEYAYRRSQSVSIVTEPLSRELLEQYGCTFLIVAIPRLGTDRIVELASVASAAKVRLALVPNHEFGSPFWIEHADIDGILLSVAGSPSQRRLYEAAKRIFDFVASLLLISILSPALLTIALLVRLESNGPVFFHQRRVGKKGAHFELYKFRSMYVDAPKYSFSPTDQNDPRITRIGRFLRRTSMDELPQLFNVLKGDMSLVGPRPEMPFIVAQYTPQHRQRLQVTPGITGLWQLSADRAYLIHQNIQYDLYYIRNRSFFMDVAILLHTAVFAMKGV